MLKDGWNTSDKVIMLKKQVGTYTHLKDSEYGAGQSHISADVEGDCSFSWRNLLHFWENEFLALIRGCLKPKYKIAERNVSKIQFLYYSPSQHNIKAKAKISLATCFGF
jgi:hypothetical protein